MSGSATDGSKPNRTCAFDRAADREASQHHRDAVAWRSLASAFGGVGWLIYAAVSAWYPTTRRRWASTTT